MGVSDAMVSTTSLGTGVPQLAHDRAAESSFVPQLGQVDILGSTACARNILPRFRTGLSGLSISANQAVDIQIPGQSLDSLQPKFWCTIQ